MGMRSPHGSPPFPRILAPVDGSPLSESGVRRSELLMSSPGARVTLFGVGPGDADSRRRVERLAAELAGRGIEAGARFQRGVPSQAILREIESGGHDLVVLTRRPRQARRETPAARAAPALLRRSPAPLLLYRALAGLDESFFAVERSEPARFRRVLLMLDGSKEAERILEPAIRLARAFDSELVFFQALGPEAGESGVESARAYLASKTDAVNSEGVSCRLLIVSGDPVHEALGALDRGADTIALAMRTGSWRSTVLGSVSRGLLRRTEGPTLCVPPFPGFAGLEMAVAARALFPRIG
jgi:nucleotide-binding universal stress UspA family protein